MSIYEKLSCISVCLGGAEVWSAGSGAGDPGSNPAFCVFLIRKVIVSNTTSGHANLGQFCGAVERALG